MRVELNVPEPVTEPRLWVKHQPVLAMASGLVLVAGIVRPKSRGHIRLTGADPHDPVEIEATF
jgi:hypothetical protein